MPLGQPKSSFTLTPVSEDFIKTFVTPKKAKKVHEAMALEKEAHRCALKILGCFFKKEELKTSNISGTNNKNALDSHKLNALKGKFFKRNWYDKIIISCILNLLKSSAFIMYQIFIILTLIKLFSNSDMF